MSVAYLDPGSGSLIASVLVGGAAAAGVAVKSARARVGGVFSRKRRSGDEQPEASGTTDPADSVDATDGAEAEADAPAEPVAASDEVEAVDAGARSDA